MMRSQDFAARWFREDLKPLRTFATEWNNSEHEFIDAELEQKRKRLLKGVERIDVHKDLRWRGVARDLVPRCVHPVSLDESRSMGYTMAIGSISQRFQAVTIDFTVEIAFSVST
jgi:hypothetical protein